MLHIHDIKRESKFILSFHWISNLSRKINSAILGENNQLFQHPSQNSRLNSSKMTCWGRCLSVLTRTFVGIVLLCLASIVPICLICLGLYNYENCALGGNIPLYMVIVGGIYMLLIYIALILYICRQVRFFFITLSHAWYNALKYSMYMISLENLS